MKNTELFNALAKQISGVACLGCGCEIEPIHIEVYRREVVGYTDASCGTVVLNGQVLGVTAV